MGKVAIVTDGTVGLAANIVKDYHITVVPITIIWDDVTYVDGVDMTARQFYDRLANSKTLPTTSQPSFNQFAVEYERLLNEGYDVLAITVSSDLSGTHASALQAQQLFPGRNIEVVDSRTASLPLGMIVILTAEAAMRGASLEECKRLAEVYAKQSRTVFVVDTLKYLYLGGRIGAASRFLGTALDLKPVLEIKDGVVGTVDRVRSRKKAYARLIEIFEKELGPNATIDYLGVISADSPELAQQLLDEAHKHFRVKREITGELGPVISVHTGPNTVGLIYMQFDGLERIDQS